MNNNSLIPILKFVLVFALSWLAGSFIYYFTYRYFAFSALNSFSLVFILFISALILKANYTGLTFFVNILAAIFFSSFYPFGQALLIILVLLSVQKILKVI